GNGHRAQVVVVADAAEHEVRIRSSLGRCLRRAAGAVLPHPFLGLGGGAIINNEIMTALFQDVAGHGIAHHAEPDPRNLRHLASPCVRSWDWTEFLTHGWRVVRSAARMADIRAKREGEPAAPRCRSQRLAIAGVSRSACRTGGSSRLEWH